MLKRDARLAPVPVVVFSALGDAGPDPVALGAACLTKPLREDSVSDCVPAALDAALARGAPPAADR